VRVKFHQNSTTAKRKLLVMAGMAEQAIQRSIEAIAPRLAIWRTRLPPSFLFFSLFAEPSINRSSARSTRGPRPYRHGAAHGDSNCASSSR